MNESRLYQWIEDAYEEAGNEIADGEDILFNEGYQCALLDLRGVLAMPFEDSGPKGKR